MWQLTASYFFDYTPMASKHFFNINYLPFLFLVFIFLSSVRSTCSHDVNINLSSDKKESVADFILCRRCGENLAAAKDIINNLSPDAISVYNKTLFEREGVEVQRLKNSFNIQFDVITVSDSKCMAVDNWYKKESWYPGYAWKPCICKRCKVHHGWVFEKISKINYNLNTLSEKAFFMLKLPNLLSEHFANSLLVIPDSYMH